MTFELIFGILLGLCMLAAFGYIVWKWHERQAEYDDIEARARFYDGH